MTTNDSDNPGAQLALDDPSLYLNRELSLLRFYRRVLEQAKDATVPLLDRLRFLTISSSILDEFFEVRVGGVKEQIAFGITKTEADGLTPVEVMTRIHEGALELVAEQYRVLNDVLLPALEVEGIRVIRRNKWNAAQKKWVKDYFRHEVLPVLTPVGLDPAHPFPRVVNKSLNFMVSLEGKDAFGRSSDAAVVQAPRVLPRLIALPREISGVPHGFVLLSSVIHAQVGELFPGMNVTGCHQFRVTRNSDLWVDEEEVEDLLSALKGELPRRHYGAAVRLEVSDKCPPEMYNFLLEQFNLKASDLYVVHGPVNLHRLEALVNKVDRPDLKYRSFIPGLPRRLEHVDDIFEALQHGDILLHHPYQSFGPVIALVRQAARDPDVLAVKMTLYRTGGESPLGEALLEAARAGKEVTAVIELRARFDEAANIELASRLQEAGAKVVYGIVGFKAHAKMLMVVRREGKALRRYVHLGTGNYNPRTAHAYTDFGLMTCDPETGEDVHGVFQQLTGLGKVSKLNRLIQTPFGLHKALIKLIDQEAKRAKAGEPAVIRAKMNSLIEKEIIQALYRASRAGVKVDLVVRGVCSLVPGIPGVSENIRVRSVVGRFLEHHRVFHFLAGGEDITLCSSADWMPRNFFRRVEVTFPIGKKKLRERVLQEGLDAYLEDNTQSWEMLPDGSYRQVEPPKGGPEISAQQQLLEKLAKYAG